MSVIYENTNKSILSDHNSISIVVSKYRTNFGNRIGFLLIKFNIIKYLFFNLYIIQIDKQKSYLIAKISLNDHDDTDNRVTIIKLPNDSQLSFKGSRADGYKQTNDLNFDIYFD